jgi:hypothetical protein
LVLTPEDVVAAQRLLATAIPLACGVVGLNANTASKITNLLRADYEYLRPILLDDRSLQRDVIVTSPGERHVMTTQQLAGEAHMSRAGLYRALESLTPSVEHCAVAFVMLLAARGDFCSATAWRICEVESPVGRDAAGPGIVGSRQRLFGVSLIGGDVDVPAILAAPSKDMGKPELVARLGQMLLVLQSTASRARRYPAEGDPSILATFGLPQRVLAEYDFMSTLLAPELHVSSLTDAGWERPLRIGNAQTTKLALQHGFASVVAESDDNPYEAKQGWRQIKPEAFNVLASLSGIVGLDLALRPSLVTYWMRVDAEGDDGIPVGALHRRLHAADAEDEPGEPAMAGELGYAVAGLRLGTPRELAKAIAYAEFLARGRGERCVKRFGEQLTPSLVKATKTEVRSLHRALRIMFNAALISVGRHRQVERLS